MASEGSLSELRGRSGTTWAGEAGGAAARAASAAGSGGGAGYSMCSGMAKYGTEGSKAG